MNLSARDRRLLAEIERRLIAEEPRLHRALSRRSCSPLRGEHAREILSGLWRRPRVRTTTVLTVLCAGIAALVVGELAGLVALVLPGAVLAGFGPLLACWWIKRRSAPGAGGRRRGTAVFSAPSRRRAAPPIVARGFSGVSRNPAAAPPLVVESSDPRRRLPWPSMPNVTRE